MITAPIVSSKFNPIQFIFSGKHMAASGSMYTNAVKGFIDGTYSWKSSGSTFKIALVNSGYTFNQDAHIYWSSVRSYEVSGTGYTAGGATLTTSDPTVNVSSNETRMDAADVSWTNSSITARGAVIYCDTGNPATSPLICYVDFGQNKMTDNSDFIIQFDASGIFKAIV